MTDFAAAKEILLRNGWFKGASFADPANEETSACCVYGALGLVGLVGAESLVAANLIDTLAWEQFPDRLEGWSSDEEDLRPAAYLNDHPDTVLDDVLILLDKAQVRWEERL